MNLELLANLGVLQEHVLYAVEVLKDVTERTALNTYYQRLNPLIACLSDLEEQVRAFVGTEQFRGYDVNFITKIENGQYVLVAPFIPDEEEYKPLYQSIKWTPYDEKKRQVDAERVFAQRMEKGFENAMTKAEQLLAK